MEPVKYSWDELHSIAREELAEAIEKHRETELGLGFPFALWTTWSLEKGESTCVEYYFPDEGKTQVYQYQKKADGWHWWKKEEV